MVFMYLISTSWKVATYGNFNWLKCPRVPAAVNQLSTSGDTQPLAVIVACDAICCL